MLRKWHCSRFDLAISISLLFVDPRRVIYNSPYVVYGAIPSNLICVYCRPDHYAFGRSLSKAIWLYTAWLTHVFDLLMDFKDTIRRQKYKTQQTCTHWPQSKHRQLDWNVMNSAKENGLVPLVMRPELSGRIHGCWCYRSWWRQAVASHGINYIAKTAYCHQGEIGSTASAVYMCVSTV